MKIFRHNKRRFYENKETMLSPSWQWDFQASQARKFERVRSRKIECCSTLIFTLQTCFAFHRRDPFEAPSAKRINSQRTDSKSTRAFRRYPSCRTFGLPRHMIRIRRWSSTPTIRPVEIFHSWTSSGSTSDRVTSFVNSGTLPLVV